MDPVIKKAAGIKPSQRQLEWHKMEFYAFAHFSINTFTDKEWGDGTEDPAIFDPTEFNADQWVAVCKSAGMKGLILTAKHHDGFCLWPSKYTEHCVKNSPWRDGKGDVLREMSEACRKGGIKFGIYLSPWDRHEPCYGDSPKYNEFYRNQLREILTGYGELFCVWFDGACGEGPNGKRQIYDWESYYKIIRDLQSSAVISICGPDVRWCGNEAGHCRPSEWSVVPVEMRDNQKIAEDSQKEDNVEFAVRIKFDDQDTGSRDLIRKARDLIWYPAEVDTSIRPGWFYHAGEDDKVRSLDDLLDVYFNSVGGNASLLLNFPPDRRGLIHENDSARVKELGNILRRTFAENMTEDASVKASHTLEGGNCSASNIVDGNMNTWWTTNNGQESAVLDFDLKKPCTFNVAVLQEHIAVGQRIEKFRLMAFIDNEWREIAGATVVGYKRILRFEPVTAQKVRVEIQESRIAPTLSTFGLFYNPDIKPLMQG